MRRRFITMQCTNVRNLKFGNVSKVVVRTKYHAYILQTIIIIINLCEVSPKALASKAVGPNFRYILTTIELLLGSLYLLGHLGE